MIKNIGKAFSAEKDVQSIQILELDKSLESADSTQNTMISPTSLQRVLLYFNSFRMHDVDFKFYFYVYI